MSLFLLCLRLIEADSQIVFKRRKIVEEVFLLNTKLLRKTKIPDWFEFYRSVCPVCNHSGGCMQHKDGEVVACIRVVSDRPFSKNSSLPSYLHFLKGEKKQTKVDTSNVEEFKGEKKLSDSILNNVYTKLINCLGLEDVHYKHLTSSSRQLTDVQINIREYRSFPIRPWEVVKELQEEFGVDNFAGVPGFFLAKGTYGDYWSISGREGILIPYRNHYNEIVGFQYRIDSPPNDVNVKSSKHGLMAKVIKQPNIVQVSFEGEIIMEKEFTLKKAETILYEGQYLGWVKLVKGNRYFWLSSANKNKGTGSGDPAPVHISVPTSQLKNWQAGTLHKARTVWLGEGPLKCDIAVDCIEKLYDPLELEDIGTTFLALPGVNSWRLSLPILKEMGVEQVNICFDADAASNPQVKYHLLECAKQLKADGYSANMVLWSESEAKGVDEILLQNLLPQIRKLF